MATFVFKVFTLAIRTASKPLANRFQNYVLAHPTLRPTVLKFAQGIHSLDFAMTRFAEGKPVGTSKRFVATLDDERAMDLAGKFVSEGFVLAVAVGVLAWDYSRGARKDEAKKVKEEAYKAMVEGKFNLFHEELMLQGEKTDAVLDAIKSRQDKLQEQMSGFLESEQQRQHSSWTPWSSKRPIPQ